MKKIVPTSSREKRITTAREFRGDLSRYLAAYTNQPSLTAHLDELAEAEITQASINEIVLWKVNRYVELPPDLLRQLGSLRRLKPKSHKSLGSAGSPGLPRRRSCNGVCNSTISQPGGLPGY